MKDLDANCAHADDWTFDNVFLFVGNMATTIGYGHIVPESQHGKLMCIICRFKYHATYDMLHIICSISFSVKIILVAFQVIALNLVKLR